jgi:hypothetical protein
LANLVLDGWGVMPSGPVDDGPQRRRWAKDHRASGSNEQVRSQIVAALHAAAVDVDPSTEEPGVRPASVAGWAGQQILRETGRIDVVAQRLGMGSLDRTARFIDWDWVTG